MHTGRRMFYRFRSFSRPANQIMFTRDGIEAEVASARAGEQTSVADYFEKKYRKLRHPNLPCINAMRGNQNKPNYLPMEVVWVSLSLQRNDDCMMFISFQVVEWQRALRPLDKQQRGSVSRNTIIKPEQRYKEIMTIVRNNQFDRDIYLKELNIHVHDKEMLKIEGIS